MAISDIATVNIVLKPTLKPVISSVFGTPNTRYAYNMDGIDDRWTLASRAIDPDGDNAFEFYSPNLVASASTIIAQNISNTAASREFHLYAGVSSASLSIIWGGVETVLCTAAQGYEPNKKYWLNFAGSSFTLAKGSQSNVIRSASFTRGLSRESSAPTIIGARQNGTGVFAVPFIGLQYDVKINGTLWPMADRNQSTQPSIPAGNNMTGTNLNPDRWTEIPK